MNQPWNIGEAGSIPDQGTEVPHAAEHLSPYATTGESVHLNTRSRN